MLDPRDALTLPRSPRALALTAAAVLLGAGVMMSVLPAASWPWVGAGAALGVAALGALALRARARARASAEPQSEAVVRERAWRELELENLTNLHSALEDLLEDPQASEPFVRLLNSVEVVSGARTSAIFMLNQGTAGLFAATSKDASARFQPLLEHLAERPRPTREHAFQELTLGRHRYLCVALYGDDLDYGLLLAEFAPGAELDTLRRRLLETLSSHLTRTICSTRRALRNRRQDLLRERATIARELHDSLAQSLSYLKIQSTRLQTQLDRDRDGARTNFTQLDSISRELRDNLNVAYAQLRELMTTFRLTMNGKDLTQAVEESIGEFEKRSTIAFDTDLRLDAEQLTAHEELQVLHIVREALANIVRHSHATRASLSLRMDEDDTVTISIRDDGIGFTRSPNVDQHHGLMIMQERARALKGELKVSGETDEGTRIDVRFKPTQALLNLTPRNTRG